MRAFVCLCVSSYKRVEWVRLSVRAYTRLCCGDERARSLKSLASIAAAVAAVAT